MTFCTKTYVREKTVEIWQKELPDREGVRIRWIT